MTPPRPLLVGPSTGPTPPYPLRMEGIVIKGFGRGSKELGIPTANLPVDDAASSWIADIPSGVYFGWASLRLPPTHPNYSPVNHNGFALHPMVMSIGYNPFYKNTVRSAEVHVLHGFGADFYGAEMRLLIVGFIRQERDYAGLDALIRDINFDCEVARRSLARPAWRPKHGLPAGEEAGELECDWLLRPSGQAGS
ncbi:riboflavin kinase [Podospora appendiculata]|uniref:Riboflavin kinase n=1 Tax=Podospora appendiculata TaxID=314037 RepID=A0AAE0XFW6_9PEZI|nr:riboflavin kinase [Podospora appendiculata]